MSAYEFEFVNNIGQGPCKFDERVYKFTWDDKDGNVQSRDMEYGEYMRSDELQEVVAETFMRREIRSSNKKKFSRDRRILKVYGRSVFLYSEHAIRYDSDINKALKMLDQLVYDNPLSFFDPSGGGAQDFLNDTENECKLLIAPNQVGKTVTSIIDDLLDLVPCDPKWPIFTTHGVKYREYKGKMKFGICSYNATLLESVIWPTIKQWAPKHSIKAYITGYCDTKVPKTIGFVNNPNPHCDFTNGSQAVMRTYEQKQQVFESDRWHKCHFDEQGRESMFDGVDERLRTLQHTPMFTASMTPHRVDGRPDTGAGSWLHRMWSGEVTKGHTVGRYKFGIDDVPNWIYPQRSKESAFKKWVEEPQKTGNSKARREGLSRYYGEWHESSGLVYDEWDRNIHWIDPFEIPANATRYRGMDHGVHNPTACLCLAVFPHERDLIYVLYREYRRGGLTISQNVRNIVTSCGNSLIKDDMYDDAQAEVSWQTYIEVESSEKFAKTVLDSRSYAQKEAGVQKTIGWLYRRAGLRVSPAHGGHSEQKVSAVKEMLQVRPEVKHYVTGKLGAPKLYVFNTLIEFRKEMEHYIWEQLKNRSADEKDPKEVPRKKDDHLMNALEYLCMERLIYRDESYTQPLHVREDQPRSGRNKVRIKRTGY